MAPQDLWDRMQAVADDIGERFGNNVAITVDNSHYAGFHFEPIVGCPMGLFDARAFVCLDIDFVSKEFELTSEGFAYCLDYSEAVIAGRVSSVRVQGRSELTVETSQGLVSIPGDTYRSTLMQTLPGWRLWGRKTTYPAWPLPGQK